MKRLLTLLAALAGVSLLLASSGCCTSCEKPAGCTACCGQSAACPMAGASDAGWVTLFDGKDLSKWRNGRAPRAENKWSIEDGAMTNVAHGNDIATAERYQDFALSLEFKTVQGGNSGVYLRGRIELQVLDSFGKADVTKQDNGAIYDQFPPKVNASKPAGEWNLLEATIIGDEVTAKLNGKLIHDRQKISEVTGGALPGKVGAPGPLLLQGDHGKVWYRNIRIHPLAAPGASCPSK